ncbi:alpha/beta fold hydrolase [Methylocystis sp. IM3]|uniref:esterase/lipase family protein n=1 Tax=unclassified Methylocystis TaxID=2625913 RepID=UPI0030F905B1
MQGEWIRRPTGTDSVIFVHGILSSGETCWRDGDGSYWPDLLKHEPKLEPLGIYVFTYETGIFSGSYRLSDVVDALKEHMRLDHVLESDRLIFVCHSMGGLVVRKLIVERAFELIMANKEVGLFLVASPSLGSSYADLLSPLAQLFGHAQADALRFVRSNAWLSDLDKEFINLKEGGKLKLKGKDLTVDKFVIFDKFWRRQVVEPFAGARYFGEPFKIAGSDHFSIAKPKDRAAIQHRLLCKFISETALAINTNSSSTDALKAERCIYERDRSNKEPRDFSAPLRKHMSEVQRKIGALTQEQYRVIRQLGQIGEPELLVALGQERPS